jgi:hypothetical protein
MKSNARDIVYPPPRLKNILEEHFKDRLYGLPPSQSKPWKLPWAMGY